MIYLRYIILGIYTLYTCGYSTVSKGLFYDFPVFSRPASCFLGLTVGRLDCPDAR